MSGEVPVGFRFKADGIDDVISRIKQLHEELNRGEITTREYRSEMREVTTNTKAATQEFNQIKGAIYAANPTLLEFTKTMSGFSSVAQTGIGITTALNVAVLATGQASNGIQDLKTQLADARLEWERFANSPQYGPFSPQAQAALSKMNEIQNQLNSAQQQFFFQQIQNWVTVGSSMVVAVNQGVQLVGFLKTLSAMMSPMLAENFGIALTGIGSALLTWVAPIAIVIAGVEGIYQLIKLLDPAFAQTASNLENSIMANWHVDSIEATLLAPFVGFAGGVVQVSDEIYSTLVTLYNDVVSNVLNPLINTWDSTIGNILGKISQLGTVQYSVPSANQILQGFGLGSNALGSSTSTNPNADAINKMLVGSPTNSTSTASALNTLQQNTMYSQSISQTTQQSNQFLSSILATGQAANQVAQQQLAQTQDQKAQLDALKQSITDNTNKIVELQKLPQTETYSAHYDPDTGLPMNDGIRPTDAANQIAQLQQQNMIAQQQMLEVGNQPALANYLPSIGLDPGSGIGSVITGALGGASAGWTSQDVQDFANTHNYGVFTAAAIRDFATQSATPTHQDQINAWLASVNGKGMGTFTAADAAKALGYTPESSSGSSNIGSGQFGGLPGQYGNPIAAANGFDGMVSGPTHFLAGEAGPEFVSISPNQKSGRSITIHNTTIVQGTVLSDYELDNTIQNSLKQALKGSGFT